MKVHDTTTTLFHCLKWYTAKCAPFFVFQPLCSLFRSTCCTHFLLFIYFYFFGLFRAAPMAYGGSQARGQIGSVATCLCNSHSHTRSEPHLRPTPYPSIHWVRPELEPASSWMLVIFVSAEPQGELPVLIFLNTLPEIVPCTSKYYFHKFFLSIYTSIYIYI